MRHALLLAALVHAAAPAAAQTTFKCNDGRGRVTYSNIACDKQGLKDAGPVAERTTTMALPPVPAAPAKPAGAAPGAPAGAAPSAPAAAPPAAKDNDAEVAGSAARVKPVVPLLERLAK